jgi:hypothetical protein
MVARELPGFIWDVITPPYPIVLRMCYRLNVSQPASHLYQIGREIPGGERVHVASNGTKKY